MSLKTLTIIGSLNTDLVTITPRVPSGGETLTASSFSTGPGGKGANQAVACARLSRPNPASDPSPKLDVTVKMIGAVGSDEFGPALVSGLKNSFIDTDGVRTVKGSTGVAVILVESGSGENRILLSPGANGSLQPTDFTSSSSLGTPLPDLLIMQLEIPLPTVLQILETAQKAGVQVLLNPAPAVPLPISAYSAITHLIVNETEAAILTDRSVAEVEAEGFAWGVVTDELLQRGAKNVVVTLGSKGAFWASKTSSGFVPAEKVRKVVDTTAAGDTFVGAYAVEVVRGEVVDMESVVKRACRAAGRTVEKEGAQSAIPWADEVDIKI
jgi:ribokinase